ncbi:UvrD-helicase domain-containing protein, partial [Exiguobacterium sp.]
MSVRWTEEQQQAISARGGHILVSAAAGSGKTAVLVERLTQRLIDPKDELSADRILVATFTNAA